MHYMWYNKTDGKGLQALSRPDHNILVKGDIITSCYPSTRRGGFVHGLVNSPEYTSFHHAKHHCNNGKSMHYHCYGGRGIEFRFTSFLEFYNHIGPKPTPQHSLDRIDVNGHYEIGNVRWATKKEQADNRRTNHHITINGETLTVHQWADKVGMFAFNIFSRISKGWCEQCAVLVPKYGQCSHIKRKKKGPPSVKVRNERIYPQ